MAVIYKIENLVTSDCYVGSTTNYSRRKKRHFEDLKCGNHHSIKLQRAYTKYGIEAFRVFELESFEFQTKEHLLNREQFYIDAIKPKYNICLVAGSQLGSKRSEQFKKDCSNRMRGKKAWNKGLKTGSQSETTKNKRSKALTGRKHSEETKIKISKIHKGRKLSKEHRMKLSKAKIKHGKYIDQKRGQIHYRG